MVFLPLSSGLRDGNSGYGNCLFCASPGYRGFLYTGSARWSHGGHARCSSGVPRSGVVGEYPGPLPPTHGTYLHPPRVTSSYPPRKAFFLSGIPTQGSLLLAGIQPERHPFAGILPRKPPLCGNSIRKTSFFFCWNSIRKTPVYYARAKKPAERPEETVVYRSGLTEGGFLPKNRPGSHRGRKRARKSRTPTIISREAVQKKSRNTNFFTF